MTGREMLKAAEAAMVAGVSLRDVNRMVDERLLPETFISVDDSRYVMACSCGVRGLGAPVKNLPHGAIARPFQMEINLRHHTLGLNT